MKSTKKQNSDNFYDHIQDDVFSKNGDNYQQLFDIIKQAEQQLKKLKSKRSCKFYIEDDFDYSKINTDDLGKASSSKTALHASLEAFQGLLSPHHPATLFNIVPPPLLGTAVLSMLTLLYNPNCLIDITAGKFIYLEKKLISYLAKITGWDNKKSGGFFTFGGKATLMYGIKAGLNKTNNNIIEQGLNGQHHVICSENNHYCVESICNFLGIGSNQCHRVPLNEKGEIDLDILHEKTESILKQGQYIAAVILNAGSTINMIVDPIKAISKRLTHLQKKYKLSYNIHLHVDTVITWPWLFFRNQDIGKLDCVDTIKNKITAITQNLDDVALADSIGIDFHKTGLCPYISSCYICKSKKDIHLMHAGEDSYYESDSYYEQCYDNISFENSRPCNGIISAYYVTKRLGQNGFNDYLLYLYKTADCFINTIEAKYSAYYEVVNKQSNGYEVIIFIKFTKLFNSFFTLHKLSKSQQESYETYCGQFIEFIFNHPWNKAHDTPFISFVPNYKNYDSPHCATAFLLYPASLSTTASEIDTILQNLTKALKKFIQLSNDSSKGENQTNIQKIPK